MPNVVDQSTWWNPLLTSEIFAWLGGTTTYILYNKIISFNLVTILFLKKDLLIPLKMESYVFNQHHMLFLFRCICII